MRLSILLIFFAILSYQPAVQAQQTYTADSIVFSNKEANIRYSGTITVPKGNKKFPALVIVSGTGKQDQDGTMAGHKQFKTIATYLAIRGIAVLRLDDRGVGNTTGIYETSTTGDFAQDALAAISFLRTRNDINPEQVGLLGHSEGGATISIAASQSDQVKFLISIAGLAMSGVEAQIRQNEDIIKASTMPEHDKQRYNDINRLMFETAFKYADSTNMADRLTEVYNAWKRKDDAYVKTLQLKSDRFRYSIYQYREMATGVWYRYLIKYNAPQVMGAIKVPVLALNGDKDIMVACGPSLANWKNLTGQGHGDVTTVVIPGVDHLFLPVVKSTVIKTEDTSAGFSPLALQTIGDWMNKRFQ